MPCFNAENYIVEAIKSILSQKLRNLELIIIDDGSTDKTERLVRAFSDKRIRYLCLEKNRGNYVARNMGLDLAQGKYIAMADADDISLPDRIQTQYDYLEANPNIAAVGSRMEIVDQDGKSIHMTDEPLEYDEIKIAFLRDNCLAQPTLMFRRSLLEAGYRYDESFR
nr:glycosyltransferase [Lunatimonas salinarum]